jgi:thiol-disulfide isomerase/thioredoxin
LLLNFARVLLPLLHFLRINFPTMKKVIPIVVLLLVSRFAVAEVTFEKLTLKEAVAKAAAEKKIVMVDFFTTWCGPCKMLDKQVYQGYKEFGDYAEKRFVAIKLDAEKEGLDDAKTFKITAYPSVLFVDASGKEIDRVVGFDEPASYLQEVKNVVEGRSTIEYLIEQSKKNPKDLDLLLKIAEKYQYKSELEKAVSYFKQARSLAAATNSPLTEQIYMMLARATYRTNLEDADAYLAAYPNGTGTSSVYAMKADYYKRNKDPKQQFEMLDKAVAVVGEQYAKDPKAKQSYAMILNNYAWAAAAAKVNLPKALEHAKLAKSLTDGQNAGYLDTLAEVYFTMGNTNQAVAEEEVALQLDPTNDELKKQLEKFKSASSSQKAKPNSQ